MFITSSLEYNQQNVDTHMIFRKQKDLANNSLSLPASCSWILSISMGVVTTTWQVPAPHPASTSPHSGKYL